MEAGLVGARSEDESGSDAPGVDGAIARGREAAEPSSDGLAGPGAFAIAQEERGSGDGNRAEGQSAEGVFELALYAIVEDARVGAGAECADEEEMGGAAIEGEAGDGERVVEVDLAETGL